MSDNRLGQCDNRPLPPAPRDDNPSGLPAPTVADLERCESVAVEEWHGRLDAEAMLAEAVELLRTAESLVDYLATSRQALKSFAVDGARQSRPQITTLLARYDARKGEKGGA